MNHLRNFLLCLLLCMTPFLSSTPCPPAIHALLERIGGKGTAEKFVIRIEETLSPSGKEAFMISTENGKPCIKGSTPSAVTTGINWYLNHIAHINLSWNRPTAPLSQQSLPLPTRAELHESSAQYRYYLNYCTFSYSMAFWTWQRWEQEIDWMALHGINMPLQLVGIDAVWRNFMKQYGYTDAQISRYIAGPGFQAWWLMGNLEGWGGPNPDWWYERQTQLAKKINRRMRELGIEPVLPGFSGQVPSLQHTGVSRQSFHSLPNGTWCSFSRPDFIAPDNPQFDQVARDYYKHLNQVMGTSTYYSMDLFHEGGQPPLGVAARPSYQKVYEAMNASHPHSKWVIQQWQWSADQYQALRAVPKGQLIVLDLFSDGNPAWQHNGYEGHDYVYCMLHNFGGRVGIHGRLAQTITDYYTALSQYPSNTKGIGATPEGLETNPVLYDALFELPWTRITHPYSWLSHYAVRRYGQANKAAQKAWQLIGHSALACPTDQQGTSEPILCARPSLSVNHVSTWSTSRLYYPPQSLLQAADLLLSQKEILHGKNYNYDVVDATRQCLSNYAHLLLSSLQKAKQTSSMSSFQRQSDLFLQLIADQDRLLSTTPDFNLRHWLTLARQIPQEVNINSSAAKNWLEWNARKQITTWGDEAQANRGGLHDYSNREWAGLLRQYYYPRWQTFFNHIIEGTPALTAAEWYAIENQFCQQHITTDPVVTSGESPTQVADELFHKYFSRLHTALSGDYYISHFVSNIPTNPLIDRAYVGESYMPQLQSSSAIKVKQIAVDFNGDHDFTPNEIQQGASITIPPATPLGEVAVRLLLSDHTLITYQLRVETHRPA